MKYVVSIEISTKKIYLYKVDAKDEKDAIVKVLQSMDNDFYGFSFHRSIVNIHVVECSSFKEI